MATSRKTGRPSGKHASRPDAGAMVTVRNVNVPGYTSRVNAAKYTATREALLRALPPEAPGMTQAEMFAAVRKHLPEHLFPGGGKANWWVKTVQLDLEAQGLVRRSAGSSPMRWHRVEADN